MEERTERGAWTSFTARTVKVTGRDTDVIARAPLGH